MQGIQFKAESAHRNDMHYNLYYTDYMKFIFTLSLLNKNFMKTCRHDICETPVNATIRVSLSTR